VAVGFQQPKSAVRIGRFRFYSCFLRGLARELVLRLVGQRGAVVGVGGAT